MQDIADRKGKGQIYIIRYEMGNKFFSPQCLLSGELAVFGSKLKGMS